MSAIPFKHSISSCIILVCRSMTRHDNCVLMTSHVQLKTVRALVVAGALDFDEFPQQLRSLENCVQLSAKDLRSQIVREACITIA